MRAPIDAIPQASCQDKGKFIGAKPVEDIAPHSHAVERATIRQKKTGQPVRFEMTGQTREAVDSYITAANKKRGEVPFGAAEVRICL
jgi:hypothetical protein